MERHDLRKGLDRCLTRHPSSSIRWPPALSTRCSDATTTTTVKGPAILTSSRSSTSADEPSPSATTVAETQASCPSATPTGWLPPTAKKRTGTSAPPSPHGWREPTSLLRPATSGRGPESAKSRRLTAGSRPSRLRRAEGAMVVAGDMHCRVPLRRRTGEAVHLLWPVERNGEPPCPVPRCLVVRHADDGEAPQVLLGLGIRAVDEQRLAIFRLDAAHHGRCVDAAVAEHEDTGGLHVLEHRPASRALRAQLFRRVLTHPLVVEGDQILGHCLLLSQPLRGHRRDSSLRRPERPTLTNSTNGNEPVRHILVDKLRESCVARRTGKPHIAASCDPCVRSGFRRESLRSRLTSTSDRLE